MLLALLPAARAQRAGTLDRERVPSPVFHAFQGLVDLYWDAWEQAWQRVIARPGIARERFLHAGGTGDAINLHDAAFTAIACKYSPHLFPGVETLDNIYHLLLEATPSPLSIEYIDHPPLLAWAESEHYRFTGDGERLRVLLRDKGFLQRYFYFFDSITPATRLGIPHRPVTLEKKGNGYRWSAAASATGNAARERDDILWVDAISQQALAALCIARLADAIDYKELAREFQERYKALKTILNKFYWDEGTGTYHDLRADDLSRVKTRTPDAYWALLAEVPTREQARRAASLLRDTSAFGGSVPWPAVSRDDPAFDAGNTVRPSLAYAGIKALERYGFLEEADEIAFRLLLHQHAAFVGRDSLADALPLLSPVSLLIENVLGFHRVDATNRVVEWRKHHRGLHGIKNLSFGDVIADIVGDDHAIQVQTNGAFTLVVNGKSYRVRKGSNTFK
jgi:hypothetical protein